MPIQAPVKTPVTHPVVEPLRRTSPLEPCPSQTDKGVRRIDPLIP